MKEIRKNSERITNVHFTKFCKLGPCFVVVVVLVVVLVVVVVVVVVVVDRHVLLAVSNGLCGSGQS